MQSSIYAAGAWSAPAALTVPAIDSGLGGFTLASAPNGTVIAAWERDDYVDTAVLTAPGC